MFGELIIFFKGFLVGLGIAAPVGPVALLTIQHCLRDGPVAGFVTGLGAAIADTLYGAVAAFGLSVVSGFLIANKTLLGFLGGLVLIALGLKIVVWGLSQTSATMSRAEHLGNFASSFAVTLANPVTIFSFFAIFAALDLSEATADYLRALTLVVGVFVGAAFWWFSLNLIVVLLRQHFNRSTLKWISRISGWLVVAFGCYALLVFGI